MPGTGTSQWLRATAQVLIGRERDQKFVLRQPATW